MLDQQYNLGEVACTEINKVDLEKSVDNEYKKVNKEKNLDKALKKGCQKQSKESIGH